MRSSDERQHGTCGFFRVDRVHAAKIQRAVAKKAGATLDLMAKNRTLWRTGTSQARFRGSKNCHEWNSKPIREVHGSSVICQEHAQSPDLLDQFPQRSLAREILSFPVETP